MAKINSFRTTMTREKIVARLSRLRKEFQITRNLLVRVRNGALLQMTIEMPNGSVIHLELKNSQNPTFEDNAASIVHMIESRLYDLRRGLISSSDLLRQLAGDIDLPASRLAPGERALVLRSKALEADHK